jgi:hypothetical protein
VLKNEVQEIQGYYGPFSLPERVLQKIWLKGDFNQSELRTQSGKCLRILDAGRWNLLEGPDFLEAQLEIEGVPVVGDVEVHFHAADWFSHNHADNPNFNSVCLHVVLYPDASAAPEVTTAKGMAPELLCLLPLLERDLEDYAVDDALLELEQVEDTQWMLDFMQKPLGERRAILGAGARARWSRKVAFARKRLQGASWREACHQYCLEVLGYARNRAPMGRLALAHPLEAFAAAPVDVDALLSEVSGQWRLSGLRPANHPRHRLQQYAAICLAHADWPERLQVVLDDCAVEPGSASLSTAAFRRQLKVPQLAERIAEQVFSGVISTKRLNTLICDALLPLAEAAEMAGGDAYAQLWQHWPTGDAPDRLHTFLKQAQIIDREEPFSNGQLQGALQLLIQR